ncbi:hypothetical protein OEZ85_008321 [Tetradesmus obliquus]|uniref:Kinesin-like protein n=1 Tax=Tetradesmus obliquus TaxID=3088 RepID=A0ABY8TII3_TETOB|nr:hypothetical protein OEZ85_008321 [Tetradesmus obliquus]
MPPVFKKAKEYDPELAKKTLGGEPATATGKAEAGNRQLLVELGLADESEEEEWDADEEANYKHLGLREKASQSDSEQQGAIAAYYPAGVSANGSNDSKGTAKVVEQLRSRLETSLQKLQADELDEATKEEVQELLFDQQHQIDLLLRGTSSMRGSMDVLRRSSREIESKNRELQEELEKQHAAALKEMEAKLEKAIQQVQQLQQTTRDRQQQQQANAEHSLQAAGKDVAQLRAKVAELQAALSSKDQALEQQAAAASNQQQLASQCEAAQQQSQQLQQQVQRLQEDKAGLEGQLQQASAHTWDVEAQLQAYAKEYQEACEKLAAHESDSQKLQWKITALQNEHQKLLRSTAEQMKQLQDAASQAQAALATIQAEADKRIAAAEGAALAQVESFKQKWREEFDKRRKLHNLVTELKGNIRVLARIRPMSEKEHSSSGAEAAVRVIDEETLSVAGTSVREYEFDRVFGPMDGQAQVFDEVSGLVTSILDGYNVCIMAYGQTGSGKTYTIEGPAEDPGVNSRALAELFRAAGERSTGFSYAFSASVLEIYNEQIFDLLAGSRDSGDKLDIKEGPQGLFIPGLRVEAVGGAEDVVAVLQKGKQHRSTFATNMNEHSSRSHLVLTIYVKGYDTAKGTSWSSKMHLIDLAGSERVSRSGAEGERLKEAAAINKSLSALGDVVAALQQRSSHVPYRNSKLTRLLEDSLGGSSKTLLVVNCSPAAENANESKCSLDFAARARKVELGAAQRNTDAPGSPGSPAAGGSSTPRMSGLSPLNTGGSGSNGGSGASSPRVNRSGGDLSSTARLAASRRAGGLQQ